MSETEVKVPNIGDFKDVEVIEVLVSEDQIIKKNEPLITIESDKSSVEIPSNFEGKIKTLKTCCIMTSHYPTKIIFSLVIPGRGAGIHRSQ